jgi:carbonic anhydrase
MKETSVETNLSRRRMLQLSLASAAAVVAMGGLELGVPSAALAEDISTPDAAVAELMAGNKRYLSSGMNAPASELAKRRQQTADHQEPFAAVLSCADSRVPDEIIFNQTIGRIFVARVAGNVITPELIGTLEYAAAVLGTKAFLVMGHSSCGAVKAAMKGEPVPGQISSLFPHIQPAVDQGGHDLEATIKANAKNQAALLSQSSPVMSEMVKSGKIKVVAGYYDLASGVVTML